MRSLRCSRALVRSIVLVFVFGMAHSGAMKRLCLAICGLVFVVGLHLSAQPCAGSQYSEAVSAFQRGENAAAIRILEPLVHSGVLTGAKLGHAWLVLGASYHGEAEYSAANHAYDMAVQLLGDDPHAVMDYAVALGGLGVLYREMGNFGAAERLQRMSLKLSEDNHDHAAVSRACADLAETSILRKRLSAAEHYIACAESESRQTSALVDDDLAHRAQIEARIFLETGATGKAIDEYQYSIGLFTRHYGEGFPLTGWGYALLASAYLQAGMQDKALLAARQSLVILGRAVGTQDPRYGAAEIRYADVLDAAGQRAQAVRIRDAGTAALQAARQMQCAGCTINAAALR